MNIDLRGPYCVLFSYFKNLESWFSLAINTQNPIYKMVWERDHMSGLILGINPFFYYDKMKKKS